MIMNELIDFIIGFLFLGIYGIGFVVVALIFIPLLIISGIFCKNKIDNDSN